MIFYTRWKFTVLMAAMFLVVGLRLAISDESAGQILIDLCGLALVAVAVLTLCVDKRLRTAALILETRRERLRSLPTPCRTEWPIPCCCWAGQPRHRQMQSSPETCVA